MLELEPIPSDVDEIASQIAVGVINWLHEEVETSSRDHNRILDDYEQGRHWLTLPADDPNNKGARKQEGHYNRQRQWGELYIDLPTNDQITGQFIFNALMQL